MTRKSFTTRGLLETTLVATFAITSTLLVGCGSDLSTAPSITDVQDESGEVQLPGRFAKLPSPVGFEVSILNSSRARLTWDAPAIGYTAIVKLDGWEIAQLDARAGSFNDDVMRAEGIHVYSLCYAKSGSMSREARQVVSFDRTENGDGRTDDLPEDGRK